LSRTFKNYYEVLAVTPAAAAAEIKRKYRRLAKRHHPDVSGGEAARFREITEAYEVLIDPKNRERYDSMFQRFYGDQRTDIRDETIDRFWEAVERQRAAWQAAGGASRPEGEQRPRTGEDVVQELKLPFKQAVLGGTVRIKVPHLQKRLEVKVPPGIQAGTRMVLNGKGQPGSRGASPGNLVLNVGVEEHAVFRREGRDLVCSTTVNLAQLMLGSKLQVKLLAGGKAELTLPTGTQPGSRLRLPELGIPFEEGQGDLLVEIQLLLPPMLTPTQRRMIENFARDSGMTY